MRIDTFQAANADYKWLESCGNGWQFGEQGIIDAIVERLGLESGTCVEIGAGDGGKLPLTCERLYHAGWRTICYEIDAYKRSQLSFKFPKAEICGAWSLRHAPYRDESMRDNYVGVVYDLAVIDTDSNDAEILRQIAEPRCASVIICEHFDKAFVNEEPAMYDIPEKMLGMRLASGATIQENSDRLQDIVGLWKQYTRIGWTRVNTFFVRTELCTKLT